MNAQGEDVVAGIRTPAEIAELEKVMPEAYTAVSYTHLDVYKRQVLDDLIFDKNQEYIYLMDRLDYYKKLFNKYYCQIDEAWYALGNTKNIELQNKLEKLQIYYSLIKRNFYLYEDDITKSKDVNSKKISPST